jgi:hypothetical protein
MIVVAAPRRIVSLLALTHRKLTMAALAARETLPGSELAERLPSLQR